MEMTQYSSLALRCYSTELRTRKYVKGYGFLSFARKWRKQLLDAGLDAVKTASKKAVNQASEVLRNKIADAVGRSNEEKRDEYETNWGKYCKNGTVQNI